jgi:hypothetical protein
VRDLVTLLSDLESDGDIRLGGTIDLAWFTSNFGMSPATEA